MKIEVTVIKDIYSIYTISQPNEPIIPGICFLCEYIKGEPTSSNHSVVKWVKKKDFIDIPESEFIPGVKNEFFMLIESCENKMKK